MPDRSEVRRLYGRKRVPRSHRRVMLALLSGAPGLSHYPLSRLAQVRSIAAVRTLARMESRGWVEGKPGTPNTNGLRRRFYRLTPKGHAAVTYLLGLAPYKSWEEDEPWLT